MDEVSAVVISRVKGRGEEVTWFAYTKPKFTAMASAEEKHWEAFANRIRNSTAPSAEGGARRRTTVCATAQHHRICATAQEAQLKEQEVRARLSGLLRKKPKTGF